MTLFKFYMDGMNLAWSRGIRYGQALFILLEDNKPELAEAIRGTDKDPFVLEGPSTDFVRWDAFADYIERRWYEAL